MDATVDKETVDYLKSLHTGAIDASNGYREALQDAEGRGLSPLFSDMVQLHQIHADELGRALSVNGEQPDKSGSFMTLVHKTIMDVRSLFNGLDESVLPGLIDGEKRNVAAYDDALNKARPPAALASLLSEQRASLVAKIAEMQSRKVAAGK